jgi:hypothetical protein
MILVLCRRGPDEISFAAWQDVLLTLALFELPLTVVVCGAAANAIDLPQMHERLIQLHDIGIKTFLIYGSASNHSTSALPMQRIDALALQNLCREASHMVHC